MPVLEMTGTFLWKKKPDTPVSDDIYVDESQKVAMVKGTGKDKINR